MHQSSYELMQALHEKHLDKAAPLRIGDLGAMDINGCYKPIFTEAAWTYAGIDLEPGPNIDIVLRDPYSWAEIPDGAFDLLISGQALEHIEFFWLTFREISRVLSPKGRAFIIAPSGGPEHHYPVDCWRFYPDAYRALAKWSGLTLLECGLQPPEATWEDGSQQWRDCWGVFQKPDGPSPKPSLLRRVFKF